MPRLDHTHIVVDQFGYRPGDPKIAVIRSPVAGYDSANVFTPGIAYEVRRAEDASIVFSGTIAQWNGGAVEPSSGDKGWRFDFTAVTAPGTYFVYDVMNQVRSPTFAVDRHVYKPVLRAAMRTYFYQRSGFAKRIPYAHSCWVDDAAYLGPGQDSEARDVTDPGNAGKVCDMSGGWFDAGDTNKYVTFAMSAVHQLLMAYQHHPEVFTDDFGIPESGNGIPDLIDEVKWEIDWLKKMQSPDGSVALKVGSIGFADASPPSADSSPRFYVPSCTSSTIAAAGMFAHAAYVFAQIPSLASEASALAQRSVKAWSNYQQAPVLQTDCDTGIVKSGDADLSALDQHAASVVAAIYLFAITGRADFDDYARTHYRDTRPYRDVGWSRYSAEQGEALLFYAGLPNAAPALKNALLADKLADARAAGHGIYGSVASDSLYRDHLPPAQYHWGSNQPRANTGNTNLDVLASGLGGMGADGYRARALDVLHYFHGVNPLGMVYLTNMYPAGASWSANRMYHAWFRSDQRRWFGRSAKWADAQRSDCGPPPGYVTGGPNANAEQGGVPRRMVPPVGQPEQKAYRDWGAGWPENSWVVTEPAIYYQAAYVKLLAAFAD